MKKKVLKHAVSALVLLMFLLLALGSGSTPSAKEETVFWDTSQMQSVTKVTTDQGYKSWAKITSDGTQLLYTERDKSGLYNIALLRNVNSSAKTQLVSNANNPAWYDNNKQFLYVIYESDSYKIMRGTVSGTGKTYITRNPVGESDTRPTVRGQAILCDTWMDGKRQLVSMRDNGTEITFLGDGWAPAWHPTESKFVFVQNWDIYEMDLTSTQVTQIYSDPNYRSTNPSYSWDGKYILFQRGAEQIKTGKVVTKKENKVSSDATLSTETRWHLFVIGTEGNNTLIQLTSGNVDAYSPSWDSNGNVYFIAGVKGKTDVYRARINLE
jgi:Tol biopolymer transport system component